MKLKKILAVMLAAVMCFGAMTVAVSAAEKRVELGKTTLSNNDKQKGWGSNGMDDIKVDVVAADFMNAKYLVLELSAKPTGEGIQTVWQGPSDGWKWAENENSLKVADVLWGDNTLVFELSKTIKNYNEFKKNTEQIKIFICYYDPDFAGLKLSNAYLTDTHPKDAVAVDPPKDGELTTNDALTVLKVAAGMMDSTPELVAKLDMDGDGKLTSADALAILRKIAGLVPTPRDDAPAAAAGA